MQGMFKRGSGGCAVKKIGHYVIKHSGRSAQYDHAKMRSLILEGKLDQAIADEVGSSRSAVVNLRQSMGIFRKCHDPYKQIDYSKINEAYLQMKSDSRIAEETGYSKTTIWKWRHDNGLPSVSKLQKMNTYFQEVEA